MNKKLIGNIVLISLAIFLGFTLIEMPKKKGTFQEEISSFIKNRLTADVTYTPGLFQEVDEAFLMSNSAIEEPFLEIQDSIRNQLSIIRGGMLSPELIALVNQAESSVKQLRLGGISDYLGLDAKLKRKLRSEMTLSTRARDRLKQEENRMQAGISQLNSALSSYNLSVFNLNFDQTEHVQYLHYFQLRDRHGLRNEVGIFELDRESREVVSFREIG